MRRLTFYICAAGGIYEHIIRCTVLAMDWPRLHHLAAIEREKSSTTSRPANKGVDFVSPAKDWEGLEVWF